MTKHKKQLTEAKDFILKRSAHKLLQYNLEHDHDKARHEYRMLEAKVKVQQSWGFDTTKYEMVLLQYAERYASNHRRKTGKIPLPEPEKQFLDEMLADIGFFGKMQDKTELLRAKREYDSALTALTRLGYDIGNYRRRGQ